MTYRHAADVAYHAEYRKKNKDHQTEQSRALLALDRATAIVYAWIASDGLADYVGRGTLRRAKYGATSPSCRASWWTPEHTLLTMTCDSEWQAMEYEGIWGARYRPRYNIEGYRH